MDKVQDYLSLVFLASHEKETHVTSLIQLHQAQIKN